MTSSFQRTLGFFQRVRGFDRDVVTVDVDEDVGELVESIGFKTEPDAFGADGIVGQVFRHDDAGTEAARDIQLRAAVSKTLEGIPEREAVLIDLRLGQQEVDGFLVAIAGVIAEAGEFATPLAVPA